MRVTSGWFSFAHRKYSVSPRDWLAHRLRGARTSTRPSLRPAWYPKPQKGIGLWPPCPNRGKQICSKDGLGSHRPVLPSWRESGSLLSAPAPVDTVTGEFHGFQTLKNGVQSSSVAGRRRRGPAISDEDARPARNRSYGGRGRLSRKMATETPLRKLPGAAWPEVPASLNSF